MSAYINHCPKYAWNGECASSSHNYIEGAADIFGDAVVVKGSGCTLEYHIDCAIAKGIICGECMQFECVCLEIEESLGMEAA